jgi:hypothetical protein
MSLEKPILNEKKLTTSALQNKKPKKFQALAQAFLNNILKKKISKVQNFNCSIFAKKNHLELILSTSKYRNEFF